MPTITSDQYKEFPHIGEFRCRTPFAALSPMSWPTAIRTMAPRRLIPENDYPLVTGGWEMLGETVRSNVELPLSKRQF